MGQVKPCICALCVSSSGDLCQWEALAGVVLHSAEEHQGEAVSFGFNAGQNVLCAERMLSLSRVNLRQRFLYVDAMHLEV